MAADGTIGIAKNNVVADSSVEDKDVGPSSQRTLASRTPASSLKLRLGVALAALTFYAIFIFRTSFSINGTRYFVLFEDAMISMRYARHLADGHGLVWNIGEEPIEGFTNLL